MQAGNIREEARDLIRDIPDDATWDDVMYRIYVRQAIEAGIRDSDSGRTIDVEQVRARFGLEK
jgi:predicted transcriptional regulator